MGEPALSAALPLDEGTALVGREVELAGLTALLRQARLVTVTGTGGVGKTSLALDCAARVAGGYPHGVTVIELAALSDPGLLADTIAAGLGLSDQDARPPIDSVLDYLRERRLLLVLDTCEHLVEACALLAEDILATAPGVVILATSRQPLDAAGEEVFQLAPLPVPRADATGVSGAVELFARRAAAAVPGFTVTDANRGDVTSLCRHLDGLPLAIELAAAQLRVHPLADLAERLGRYPALRDSIGWSYELCDPAERLLWERASVFPGPFGKDTLEQVCAGDGLEREAVMDTVFGLIDKSVLLRTEDDSGSLYLMLDTIREYGAERLAASGAGPRIRDRLVDRYLTMAEKFDASPLVGQLEQYRALRREHACLRAALEAAFARSGREDEVASLVVSLHWYWLISGLLAEGCYWLTRVLELFPGPSAQRARALGLRGFLAACGGESVTSLQDTSAAVAMATGPRLTGRARLYYVRALLTAGRLADIEEAARHTAALLEAAGDRGMLPILDVMLAFKHWASGELEECVARCEAGLRRTPVDLGERWASSYFLGLSGLARLARGDPEGGSDSTRRAMLMKQELNDAAGIAYGLGALAMMAAREGRYERVAWLLGAADPLWGRVGSVLGGIPEMAERTQLIISAARDALGEERYARLRADAAQVPLEVAVKLAVEDADSLPG